MLNGKMDQGGENITFFSMDGAGVEPRPVRYKDMMAVKEGVICETYALGDTDSEDLAIVTVSQGHKTPLQQVVSGIMTTEGYVSRTGTLSVTADDGSLHIYKFGPGESNASVGVRVGQLMQWAAGSNSGLVFYEICEPPYEDGRFENLIER